MCNVPLHLYSPPKLPILDIMKTFFFATQMALLSCERSPEATPIPPQSASTTVEPSTTDHDSMTWDPDSFAPPTFMTETLQTALTDQDWGKALTLISPTTDAAKVLSTWVAIQAGQANTANHNYETLAKFEAIPSDLQNYMLGTLLLETKPTKAQRHFALIPKESPFHVQAQWMLVQQGLSKESPSSETLTQLKTLVDLEHPFNNGDAVLTAWLEHQPDDASGYKALRTLWSAYPYSKRTKTILPKLQMLESKGSQYKANNADWNVRSTQQMLAWQWKSLIAELKPIISTLKLTDSDACAVRYAYGRAHFKINAVTKASQLLPKVGTECVGKNNDVGAKAWYLIGKSYERKKMWSEAAEAYQKIPELYPEHTMADDGYALAGIGLQESGDLKNALAMWEKQVKAFPTGDLVGEGYWRLAWTSFLEGNTSKAIAWTQEAQQVVPASGHPYQYFAFPYWEARWKIYPSKSDHGVQNSDPEQVAEGIDLLKRLVSEHPSEFYSLLAAGHLWELAPQWMKSQQWEKPSDNTWTIPTTLGTSATLVETTQLMQLGLFKEAQRRFKTVKNDSVTTFAMYAHLVGQENWSTGHDLLHKYIQKHPSHTWTENQDALWLQAHPNQYWDILSAHAKNHPDDYPYDIRIFHALVREESSFNKDIVSWAGAKGLSQLMPATADRVAKWVGLSVNSTTIFEPSTNLRIGSKYLGYLHGYFNGNPYLAVAAYNAGEGNVGKWLKSKGNLPTDMFVESIPFRETRHYVKRVLGTYQTYHLLYDHNTESALFTDLHQFNHVAKP